MGQGVLPTAFKQELSDVVKVEGVRYVNAGGYKVPDIAQLPCPSFEGFAEVPVTNFVLYQPQTLY